MRILMLTISILCCSSLAQAHSLQGFLDSKAFDEICAKSIQAFPFQQTPGQIKTKAFLVNRPSFAESENHFYIGQRELADNKLVYTVYEGLKQAPEAYQKLIRFKDKIYDIEVYKDQLWVLAKDHIKVLDRKKKTSVKIIDLEVLTSNYKHDRSHAFTKTNGLFFVAFGVQNLKVVDPNSLELTATIDLNLNSNSAHESKTVAVAPLGNQKLVLAATNLTFPTNGTKAFNGLILYDIKTKTFTKHALSRSSGVLAPVVSLKVRQNQIFINNLGTMQRLSVESLENNSEAQITYVPTKIRYKGNVHSSYPIGDFFISEDNELYACTKLSFGNPKTKKTTKLGLKLSPKNLVGQF